MHHSNSSNESRITINQSPEEASPLLFKSGFTTDGEYYHKKFDIFRRIRREFEMLQISSSPDSAIDGTGRTLPPVPQEKPSSHSNSNPAQEKCTSTPVITLFERKDTGDDDGEGRLEELERRISLSFVLDKEVEIIDITDPDDTVYVRDSSLPPLVQRWREQENLDLIDISKSDDEVDNEEE